MNRNEHYHDLNRSDHNEDKTGEILKAWEEKWSSGSHTEKYHSIEVTVIESGQRLPDQLKGPLEWSKERFTHVMNLREEGIFAARKAWADWVGLLHSCIKEIFFGKLNLFLRYGNLIATYSLPILEL